MIKVEIVKENTNYKKITLLGHALYADYGKDIVCSAVSSIVITTVNGILSLNKDNQDYKSYESKFVLNIKSTDQVVQKLIENMVNLLKELSEKYPKNIKVK